MCVHHQPVAFLPPVIIILIFIWTPKTAIGAEADGFAQQNATLRTVLARYFNAGNAAEAKSALVAINTKWPTYPPAMFDLAILSEVDGNWQNARSWLSQYLAANITTEQKETAEKELSRIDLVEDADRNTETQRIRLFKEQILHAQILLDFGMPNEALQRAADAVDLNNNDWEGYAAAAEALARVQMYSRAAKFLEAAVAVSTGDQQQSLRKARNTCRMEEQYLSFTHLAATELHRRHFTAAAGYYNAAWGLFPMREQTAIALGLSTAMSGDYRHAEDVFVILRSSGNPEIASQAREMLTKLTLRGLISPVETEADRDAMAAQEALRRGDVASAEDSYKDAITREPANAEWHLKLAGLMSRLKQWDSAGTEYRRAFILDPKNLDTLANLGAVLIQQADFGSAVAVYVLAVQRQPASAIRHDELGTAYYLANMRSAAVFEYARAAQLDPGDANFAAHLTEARDKQSK